MKQVNNINEYAHIIKSNEPVAIKFFTPYCMPCKMLTRVMDGMGLDNVYEVNLDSEEFNFLAVDLNVVGVPTVVIFQNGKEIKRNTGFMNKDQVTEFMKV